MINIGVDVGGTFTDFTVFDEETREAFATKTPTTYPDPLLGVLAGIDELGIGLERVRRFVHGTTIVTNAILQRRGVKAAFITTEGFRDHIEIADTRRYTGGQFDPEWVSTAPLIPRPLRFEVAERVMADGSPLVGLDEGQVLCVVEQLRAQDVESVAVGFLHSYAHPHNERRVGALLSQHLPDVPCTLSSDVSQEWREFPRWSTAVINAYVAPLIKGYVERLTRAVRDRGYAGGVQFMTSNGGLVTEDSAASYPVRLILSGPAAGPMAGSFLGAAAGSRNLITYDMGGTSTDVCLVRDLQPEMSSKRVLEAFPILIPMLDIHTIGAGGGSIAWVDQTGALRVGPQSAGASPGPACYDKGGDQLTVTDANLLLGRIGPGGLLGGRMGLRLDLAEKAAQRLGEEVGIPDVHRLAEGVAKIVTTNMAGAVRQVSTERGHDPRDFALAAFGGAGPLHAIPIAEELGIPAVLVPREPGNICAMGLLVADVKHDYVRTHKTELSQQALPGIRAVYAGMENEAREALRLDGVPEDRDTVRHSMYLRYLGQAWELEVPVESHEVDLAGISDAFHREHERAYGYRREGHAIEVVNLGLTALGYVADPDLTLDDAGGVRHEPLEHRDVYFEGRFVRCPVYDRRGLAPGATISGPAVVEEFGSTTLIFPGWVANADSAGNLLMEAREAAGGGRSDGIAVEGGEPDPITLEVVQAFLVNVTREMSATLARSAWSPALTETLDFGLGILTADGDLVAASQELPFHTFAVPFHVRYALEVFGDDIHPGDVLLTNDPYTAGPHLNDMVVLCPFFDGDRLALFIAVRAHWTDVGGRVPGSMVGGAREIFEEGIRVPMVKIHNRGELNAHLLQTILTNCRNPDEREGDFASMLGTCKTAESRLKELFERYTAGVVERCIEAVLDRSDHTVRRAVAELPDGEYYYEEYMENTGIVATPVPLRCKLTISGDRMTFDFAGSSPQVDGPVNAGPAMGFTGVFNMVKSFLERETPVNLGAMRSVTVLQEEGSFLHALPPASVAAYSEVCYLVENAFIGLMAQIIPERIGVPPECGANHTYLSGWDAKRGLHWISYEYPRGGSPASPNVDGSHVVVTYDLGDIATILPVEKMELDNPVLVLRNELRRDSEGAGYRRSGLGGVREVKVLDPDGASLSLMGEMAVIPRMGLCGGYPG